MTNLMELIKYLQEHAQELGLDIELTSKLKIPDRFLRLKPSIQLKSVPMRKVELWLTHYIVLAAWIKPEIKSDPIKNEVSISITEIQKLELFKFDTSKQSDTCSYFAVSIPKQEEGVCSCANQSVIDFLNKAKNSSQTPPPTACDELVKDIVKELEKQNLTPKTVPLSTYGHKSVYEQTQPLRETTLLHLDMYRKIKWRVSADSWGQNQLQLSFFKNFFNQPGHIVNINQLGYWALKYEETQEFWHSISVYECEGDYLLEVLALVEREKLNKFNLVYLERISKPSKKARTGIIELICAKLASQVETAISP